jgi:hypothetical protein
MARSAMSFAERALDMMFDASSTPEAGVASLSAALAKTSDQELPAAARSLLDLAAFLDTQMKQPAAARLLLGVFRSQLPRMERLAAVDASLKTAVDEAARLGKSLGSESSNIPLGARGPAPAGTTKGGLMARFELHKK